MSEYKLSCSLTGHSLDVRAVCTAPDSSIISGSRDATAKVWRPNGINPGYHEAQTLRGHSNFVTCVCYCSPSESYPNGLILTSGNDKNICGFVAEQESPLFTLKGHTDAVCCLSLGREPGTILTASWDKTAKVWNYTTGKQVTTLRGHELAVWSVIEVSPGRIVTGAADKTVKMWEKSSATCLSTLTGHTDCVRALARVSDHEFLSCANDATVRQWSTTGDCLGILYGHSNYIYSLAVDPNGNGFASVGEDSSLRVWKDANVAQVLTLPAQSVWSVAYLPNSDIVTGSSDGVVRVFSRDPMRQASEDVQKCYEAEIEAMFKVSSQELGGVKISDLPGKEALFEPGKSDGQTRLIREGTKVTVYSWSAEQKDWTKVGDVAGANEENSGKSLHQGKEYDFVFSIDIKDGVPPLKLPYNVSEDPWVVAQKFIHDNDLPQAYLEQIANFIVTNAKKTQQPTIASAPQGQPEFCDPFTGGNRYIPGGSQGGSASSSGNFDPFTGGSSYVPGSAPTRTVPPVTTAAGNFDPLTGGSSYVSNGAKVIKDSALSKLHFPQKSYVRFDQANLKAMLDKLQELNQKLGGEPHQVEGNILENVVKLAEPQNSLDSSSTLILQKILKWPQDVVFPVLDVARLAVRHANMNQELCDGKNGKDFMSMLQLYLQPAPGPNLMLALRIVSNMLGHAPGEALVTQNALSLLQQLDQYTPPFSKPLEVAIATLLLNLSVLFTRKSELFSSIDAVGASCLHVLPLFSDKEAVYRSLVACGTLLSHKSQDLPNWAQELWPHIISMSENDDERIQICSQQILAIGS
ncbi:phospholipase A-2-activating protein [Thrips palmi]|uniref:Phospholipase A-2-activating protein n=1 Tax=Thrips palmi TaxID=161013 RepID=A0A6P8Z3F3_THRPL|nr:phospholipase A-2-activating protein [Thrips palmi]